jgi:DNA-binding transcriptional ArsR family regulator
MPIRFRLPPDAAERVSFTYSPLFEAVLSLHVLAEPKHHPLQHGWMRAMRRLPASLKREIAAHSFLYRGTIADCFLPADAAQYVDFETELRRLRTLPAGVLAYELTRPLYDHGGRRPRRVRLQDEAVRRGVLGGARRLGSGAERVARTLLEDPPAVAESVASMLEAYWEAAFAEEWARVEPLLAAAVEEAGRDIARGGLYPFVRSLAPQLRIDEPAGEFGIDVPHDHAVEVSTRRPLALVPSWFVWPHVLVNCDEPWPLSLAYGAPAVRGQARRRLPPAELRSLLNSLADGTRLTALRLIAERPRSTQELAPLVGLTEAGLSKHLRVLADAGVLTRRREGYYVLYSLVPQRLDDVSDALRAFVAADAELEPTMR